jgi:acid stress-induced BolA-like protein IbaG/YrbA
MSPDQAPVNPILAIKEAVEGAIEQCHVEVEGGRGHFTIDAASPAFDGKGRLERQRMVLRAIAHLMSGPDAPVHAVDRVTTRVP